MNQPIPQPPRASGGDHPPTTGLAAVDEVTARLAELDGLPVEQHVDRLTEAHDALHRALHPEPLPPGDSGRDRDDPPRP